MFLAGTLGAAQRAAPALHSSPSLCPTFYSGATVPARGFRGPARNQAKPPANRRLSLKMPLAVFERMFDFSKSSLSSEGIPRSLPTGKDNLGTAMLPESYLLEQIGRVQQPPSCERPFASPKSRLSFHETRDLPVGPAA